MKMKAINHKPMNRPKETPTLQGGEEVRSLLDTYLPSLQPSERFILAIVILVMLFPLLLYGFLLVTGFATIAAILIFVGTHTAREMMAELVRIVRRK
jgi:hypothetical protein